MTARPAASASGIGMFNFPDASVVTVPSEIAPDCGPVPIATRGAD
jgi:hypothetical protein